MEVDFVIHFFMFGLAGSGKDTVSQIVEELFQVCSIGLADGVKKEYTRFTGKTEYRKNRKKLIQIGETYKLLYGKDVWCQLLLSNIQKDREAGRLKANSFLVRDGRYDHEYEFFVQQRNYIPIRVVADQKLRI